MGRPAGFGRTASVADGGRPEFGGPRLGGVRWRTCLADQLGGPVWRCRLWRCGIERRLIGTLRCEDRQVPVGVSWSLTVSALWLALSDWRGNLAVSVGGPPWRTSLAVSPVAVRDWAATDRHASMRGSAGCRWGEWVSDSWRSLTGGATWRCQLAVSVGGTTWRTSLAVSPVAVRD
jgi:hypothetical protein